MDDLISRQAAIECLIDALYDLDEADYVDKTFIEEELKKVPSVNPNTNHAILLSGMNTVGTINATMDPSIRLSNGG